MSALRGSARLFSRARPLLSKYFLSKQPRGVGVLAFSAYSNGCRSCRTWPRPTVRNRISWEDYRIYIFQLMIEFLNKYIRCLKKTISIFRATTFSAVNVLNFEINKLCNHDFSNVMEWIYVYHEGHDMSCYFPDSTSFVGNCFYKFWYTVFKYLKKI